MTHIGAQMPYTTNAFSASTAGHYRVRSNPVAWQQSFHFGAALHNDARTLMSHYTRIPDAKRVGAYIMQI
jgi:hypothetical protein